METNWAAENLQTIRTLMERSALYRRALAPIMTFNGTVGIVAGVMGWFLKINSGRGFILFWLGVAMVAVVGSFLLARRQALKDSESFWSPPTKRVAEALVPPLSVGVVISIVALCAFDYPSPSDWIIVAMSWTWLYGCAIHSAGFFMPGRSKLFGWPFIIIGCALLCCLLNPETLYPISPHMFMASVFGGLHLAYGIYLYFTEKRGNES